MAILGSVGYRWDQGYRAELEYSFRNDHAKDANANNFPLTGSLRDNSLMANFLGWTFSPATGSRPIWVPDLGVSWVAFDSIQGGGGHGYSEHVRPVRMAGHRRRVLCASPHWQLTGEVRYKESDRHSYGPSVTAGPPIPRF